MAAESQCCAFLELDLEHTPDGTVLTIRAPTGGEPVVDQLVQAFGGSRPVVP